LQKFSGCRIYPDANGLFWSWTRIL